MNKKGVTKTDAQRLRDTRRQLKSLTESVSVAIAQLDVLGPLLEKELNLPKSLARQRGQLLCMIIQRLDMANDSALHFGLDKSFPTIQREKEKLASKVKIVPQHQGKAS